MLKRLTLIAAAALGLIASTSADAQMSGGVATLPPGGSTGRRAVIKEPPPPVIVVVPNHHHNPSHPAYYNVPQPVAFTLVPAIIYSDGSIYGNFGFGYEPVVRPCNGVVVVGQPQRIASNGKVLSNPNNIPYTPPVPNQQTASQQMLTNTLSVPAQSGCFSRDHLGRVFVYRRS